MKTLEWLHYTKTQRRRLFSYLKKNKTVRTSIVQTSGTILVKVL